MKTLGLIKTKTLNSVTIEIKDKAFIDDMKSGSLLMLDSDIKKADEPASEQYDKNGNAAHYMTDRINDIVKMERIFGTKAAMSFCELTEFKYRMRVGKKPGQPIEQELIKAGWYSRMAKILQDKLGTNKEVVELTPEECSNPMDKK